MKIIADKLKRLHPGTKRALDDCFQWLQELDVVDIDHVELSWRISDVDFAQLKKKGTTNPGHITGFYCPKNVLGPAFIALFLEPMYFPLPSLFRSRPFTTLHFAHAMAHEVGHHLIATRGYVFEPSEKYNSTEFEEEMANRYAFEVVTRMKKKWLYRFADRVLKHSSELHFDDGRKKWMRGKYAEAAVFWLKSLILNPENQTIEYWYVKAKSKADEERLKRLLNENSHIQNTKDAAEDVSRRGDKR